jgi:ABC-2 type transport system ATP-binding protein
MSADVGIRYMTKEAEYAIEVENLTKRYGDLQAVNNISFKVRKGDVFALLGPNGAGKTTTVEIIETIRRPTSGSVRLLGMDVTRKKRDIVRRIGVLPQGFSSFDRITVRETMQYYSRLFGGRKADIDGLIELVNLKETTPRLSSSTNRPQGSIRAPDTRCGTFCWV